MNKWLTFSFFWMIGVWFSYLFSTDATFINTMVMGFINGPFVVAVYHYLYIYHTPSYLSEKTDE